MSKLSNDTLLKEDNNGKDEENYNLMRLPVVTRIKCFDEEKEVAQKVLGIQRNDKHVNDEKLKENCSGNTHNDSSGKFQVASSRKKRTSNSVAVFLDIQNYHRQIFYASTLAMI